MWCSILRPFRLNSTLHRCSHVPHTSVKPALKSPVKISKEIIEHLERLSLVDFGNQAGIKRLEAAIEFADRMNMVETDGVSPMVTVLENRSLYLRNDQVTDGNCRNQILKNASRTEESYFVAPPGNIPLVAEVDY